LEHVIFTCIVVAFLYEWYERGLHGVLTLLVLALKRLPGVEYLIHVVLSGEVKSFTKQFQHPRKDGASKPPKITLPEKGVQHEELLKEMKTAKAGEQDPEDGRMFAYVYTAESDNFALQRKAYDMFAESTGLSVEHDRLVRMFHHAFMHENALNPMMFPSLRRFENEVVAMTASIMHGDDEVVGSLTSGGTESILMAMKSYKERAKKLYPQIKNPEMVAPITIHPAHEKAAWYFGFTIVHVPVGQDGRPNVTEYENAITPRTIALLVSAPQYCHGVVDPIEEIAEIAVRRGLPLHVDSCFGGFMLPWVEKLGYPVPKFDFRVPGVTSITADIHKYGFGAKGASVVLYKNEDLRKYQFFAYSKWPGGLFASPTMAGTRPGGNIAAAWVALRAMGQDGYMNMAKRLMDTTEKLKAGIKAIPGLTIIGRPHMTAFAIGSSDAAVDILALADAMETQGWKVERQQHPVTLHCTISPHHIPVADDLLKALEEAVATVKRDKTLSKKGTAGMYGMVGQIPDKAIIDDFLIEFFSEVYKA